MRVCLSALVQTLLFVGFVTVTTAQGPPLSENQQSSPPAPTFGLRPPSFFPATQTPLAPGENFPKRTEAVMPEEVTPGPVTSLEPITPPAEHRFQDALVAAGQIAFNNACIICHDADK